MNLIQKTCTENPAWMYFSIKHWCESLSSFSKKSLLLTLNFLALNIVTLKVCKKVLIENIVESFGKRCLELAIKSDSDLLDLCHTKSVIVNVPLRSTILATIMLNEYSSEIFYSFCKPDEFNLNIESTEACGLPWLHLEMSLIPCRHLSSLV